MHIDPRLNDIDDCLYRVAARVLIVQNDRVLLVQEPELWWAFPGGGIDHGESIEASLLREIEEELGAPPHAVTSDFGIVHYTIGTVVQAVPRMNLYFKATVLAGELKKTDHVTAWAWFTKDAFLQADLNPSYDKITLVDIIFGKGTDGSKH